MPIYYHRMFLGLIVTGGQRRRFSPGEIRLLKIFASKIAILSVNRFFLDEIVRKRELEKEYELAARVQKKFLPPAGGVMGRFELRVYHETASLMIRNFTIFSKTMPEDDIRVSAYRIKGNIAGTSILMPGVQSVLQSSLASAFPGRCARADEADYQGGAFTPRTWSYCTAPSGGAVNLSSRASAIRRPSSIVPGRIDRHRRQGRSVTQSLMIQPGDIMLLCCDAYYRALAEDPLISRK